MFTSIKEKYQAIFLLFFFITLCGLVTWVRTSTVKHTYRYVQNERELKRLQESAQDARVRWLRATSPRRLEIVAKEVGLSPARMEQRVRTKVAKK